MKVYNTLTRTAEEMVPQDTAGKNVSFYQCGPTVYWVQHIGNLRAMTWADLMRRSLAYLGYRVKFVRNYTDVGHLTSDEDEGEDKMEKGAKREHATPQQIADKYISIFENDTKSLNLLEPDHKPRATEYIPQMIEMIGDLINKKHAYITEYAIYFDVSTFKDYNRLNKQKIDFNKQGMGKGTVEDPQKKHFADFALWFFKKGAHKNALQTWQSPWGEGFPGWHLECSVMSKSLLGPTIDIHMGGVEHIPVHHTNEIAQSESANGVKFVNYWLHNEHLNVDNAKMAKSQGTGFTLQEIRDKGFDSMDLRYFFLQAHYRSKQNFTWEALGAAKTTRLNLESIMMDLNKANHPEVRSAQAQDYLHRFKAAIENDFQIPQAVALMWDLLSPNVNIPDEEKYALVMKFDEVFGLKLNGIKKETIPSDIASLAEQRKQAKMRKDFQKADDIRKKIEEQGYLIEDTKDGFKIKKTR